MNTTPVTPTNLAVLARMLDRLERSGRPVDAGQFRSIVQRVAAQLQAAAHDAQLEAVLDAFPAVAELYENLQYQHAGLCRSPLDAGLAAESQARAVIQRAQKAAA
jgi:hypothetical protein